MLAQRQARHLRHPMHMHGQNSAAVLELHPIEAVGVAASIGVAARVCQDDRPHSSDHAALDQLHRRDLRARPVLGPADAKRMRRRGDRSHYDDERDRREGDRDYDLLFTRGA